MCTIDPVTLGVISLVSTLGSAVMGGIGSVQQAKAQNSMAEYNAKVAENNAKNAQAEADYARAQSWRNANENRKETAQLIGAQRAKMGASGAVVDSGTFLDLSLSTVEQGEISAMAMAQEGEMAAWRAGLQRDNYLQSAQMSRASKVNTGSVFAGSLLSGAAQVGGAFYGLSKDGIFAGSKTTPPTGSNNPKKAW